MSKSTDQLARDAFSGDAGAWKVLFERLTPRLFSVLRRLGAAEADAAELVQETWLKIVKNQEKYDRSRPFEPFIFTIATRLWIDVCRGRGRTPAMVLLPEDVAGCEVLPLDLMFAAEQAEQMRRCLEILSDEERSILRMRFWQQQPNRKVGQQLGISESSARGKSYRAVRKLADCMHLEEKRENSRNSPSATSPRA